MQQAELDPQLFNQHKRAAFLQALLSDAIDRLTEQEVSHSESWHEAVAAFNALKTSICRGDATEIGAAMATLERILTEGDGRVQLENKARALISELGELSKIQYQGMKTAAEVVTLQELQLFMVRLTAELRAIDLHDVPNPDRIRHQLATAVARAAGVPGS